MKRIGISLLLWLCAGPALAARIGDVQVFNAREQAWRFITLQDPSVIWWVLGALLLGASCGLLGSFIVVRRMALLGDTLSHAVLPGVVLGYMWNMEKDPIAILIGATIAGLLGTALVSVIRRTTKLKEDAALGMILASFFALGIALLTMIQQTQSGNQSGLDKFLFGQIAAVGRDDVMVMAAVTAINIGLIFFLYKGFLMVCFDEAFAQSIGIPARALHYLMMLMLAVTIVISLKSVGVVLVSAMLVTPAATAFLLTIRLRTMLLISALIGMVTGVCGAFLSYLGSHLPTGPLMVLSAGALFLLVFLFSPHQGLVLRWWRHRDRADRVQQENLLKAMYHVMEDRQFDGDGVSLESLAKYRRQTMEEARREFRPLLRKKVVSGDEQGQMLYFTPASYQRACQIVRNHRLWELYLTNAANYSPDHVHDDAEEIEHILGEETVRKLERLLNHPRLDPHGKSIPGIEDIIRHQPMVNV